MSAALFALPFDGRCLSPSPAPKPRRLEKGCRVVWLNDHDTGEVTGLIPGQAVAIQWDSTGRIEVYPLCSLAVRERIAVLDADTQEEVL